VSVSHDGPARPAALTRSAFLARAGLVALGAAATGSSPVASGAVDPARQPARWKGRPGSKVKRWDVVTVGNLSRNRYWGESDDRGVRPTLCTCTLVQGAGFRLLVDPSFADAAAMTKELDRRTGRKPGDVTACFVTHEHGDHFAGVAHFPAARWLASPGVAEVLNRSAKLPRQFEGVTGRLFDAVDVVPTPGHTAAHHSIRFDCDGLSVMLAGDAVATRDFFRERRPFYNAVDVEQSRKTMDAMAAAADVIVPGHDNFFLSEA
jgi:glyoxylase-like metal-dependent hydrolase (beta-lactamase superfamily II)